MPAPPAGLLLVTLHDLRRSGARDRDVLVELPAGAPLAQQVPGLVESLTDLAQARLLFGRCPRAYMAFLELAFFGDEVSYALVQLSVFHRVSPSSVSGNYAAHRRRASASHAGSAASARSGTTSAAM